MTDFKESTGIDVSIIIGDIRCATTMVDASGNSMKDQAISAEVYSKLQNGEIVYDDNLLIGSQKYLVYYAPLTNSAGDIYGSLFVGYDKHKVSAMMSANILKMVGALCVVAVIAIIVIIL